MKLAWHFASTKMRDGRELGAPGEVEEWGGPVVLCKSGLHASESILDAIFYAPGALLRRVEITGQCEYGGDKLVGQRRRILWEVDMTSALRLFARQCALDVRHLWDMPDVVFEYLMTGDERIRHAARDAAWHAAWHAARSAAWDATWDATTWGAAWHAARDAERYAADAARDAAWSVVRSSARNAACAARGAARDAAWDAAWNAAKEKQEARLVAYAHAARCGLFVRNGND